MPKARNVKNLTKGALALAHAGHSTEQIARACDVSEAAVNYWIAGQKKPAMPMRRKLRKLYGVGVTWWDEPAGDGADVLAKIRPVLGIAVKDSIPLPGGRHLVDVAVGAPIPREFQPADGEDLEALDGPRYEGNTPPWETPAATTPKEVRDLAGEYIDRARKLMNVIDTDKVLTFSEKARLTREISTAIDKAGKLTGASAEIPESKILRSPAWQRLGKRIADAILSYEDKAVAAAIMRKVADALKEAE